MGENSTKEVSNEYRIAAKHEAFGVEGERPYTGTEQGARRAAKEIASRAGHGWTPIVWFVHETGAIELMSSPTAGCAS